MARGILLTLVVVASLYAAAAGPLVDPQEEEPVSTHLHSRASKARLTKAWNDNLIVAKYRLPTHVKPLSYDIKITPILPGHGLSNFADFDMPGLVRIRVKTEYLTADYNNQQIRLNANGIKINGAGHYVKLYNFDTTNNQRGTEIPVTVTPDAAYEFLNIDLQGTEVLKNQTEYEIEARYLAQVGNDGLYFGVYSATYTDYDGAQHWLATTQMETTGFRRMSPGFDEPSFKATFKFRIGRQKEYISRNNAPLLETHTDPDSDTIVPAGWEMDEYDTTVKMSSYLTALFVAKFKCTTRASPVLSKFTGICGPAHLIDAGAGDFATKQQDAVIEAFEKELGIKYAEKKMESVAVPRNYFLFGAMENYGLNIYRDDLLLEYGQKSNEAKRYSVTSILAHELAHQWFGNYVTAGYWTHIWLNEGFATYMAYVGTDRVEKDQYFDIHNSLSASVQSAMRFDAGESSHPVINDPEAHFQIENLHYFDAITYSKGGSLIRMMENLLGRENLMRGLTNYLTANQFSNTFQTDLFGKLESVVPLNTIPAGITLETVMNTWTLQKGFPLVRVSKTTDSTIRLTQERFALNALNNVNISLGNEEPSWEVPVSVVTAANPDFANHKPNVDYWIRKNQLSKTINIGNANQWFLVNPEGYGYFRVLYEPQLLQNIQAQLNTNHSVISPLSRAKLIEEYFRFAENGYTHILSALDNLKYIGKEDDQLVWTTVLNFFGAVQPRLISTNSAFAELQRFMSPKVDAMLDLIGWQEPAVGIKQRNIIRPRLMDWACFLNSAKCAQTATFYFDKWSPVHNSEVIPINIRQVLLCHGIAKDTGNERFEKSWAEYKVRITGKTEFDSTQASWLASGLACTENVTNIHSLLNQVSSTNSEVGAHKTAILNMLFQNPQARSIAYEYLKQNWSQVAGGAPEYETASLLSSGLSAAAKFMNTEAELADFTSFAELIQNQASALYQKINFASLSNTIKSNIAWAKAELPIYKTWMANA